MSLYTVVGSLRAFGDNPEGKERPLGQLRLVDASVEQLKTAFSRTSGYDVTVVRNTFRLDGLFVNLTTKAKKFTDADIDQMMSEMTEHLTAIRKAAKQRMDANLAKAGLTSSDSIPSRKSSKLRPVRVPAQRGHH